MSRSVESVPLLPAVPAVPAVHPIKGVIEALDKIRVESAGNPEIERLIESIMAKLVDQE